MRRLKFYIRGLLGLFLLTGSLELQGQAKTLDAMEETNGWSFIRSQGVQLNLSTDTGHSGKALRFEYSFPDGTGYGGIQKILPLDLPDNYQITFYLRAESPGNNFEIKFIDSSGQNVWWVNNRNFDFPNQWTRIRIKKRHIGFAWGPTDQRDLSKVGRLEFTVASSVGGEGTLWIDDLRFEELPPESTVFPEPVLTREPGSVLVDFLRKWEFGGFRIDWIQGRQPDRFEIQLSEDGQNWETAYTVRNNLDETSYVRLAETEARMARIDIPGNGSDPSIGIRDLKILSVPESVTLNDFVKRIARDQSKGDYPRQFLNEASYWNVIGVNRDVKEALINEDGMVEPDKAHFSVEPVVRLNGVLYPWSDVAGTPFMGNWDSKGLLDLSPGVLWEAGGCRFKVKTRTVGKANVNSLLIVDYEIQNIAGSELSGDLYLLVRPFQVNPWYQFLNLNGGVGRIKKLSRLGNKILVDGKPVILESAPDGFAALSFDQGNPINLIRGDRVEWNPEVTDPREMATGIIRYRFNLAAGELKTYRLTIPFYPDQTGEIDRFGESVEPLINQEKEFWNSTLSHVKFNLPPSADRLIQTYRANLAYILINRDKAGIQPGSRSYERSWIRDGALTSSALLKSGIVEEVRDFIKWYAGYQYPEGKVPCVVDHRGPDPVPENDSHGQFIYLIREYFNFTGDTAFLREMNPHVLKAVDYIEFLVAQRSTDYYRNGSDSLRAHYGLVPESISHEGYSAKPMHSYWDNFFTMKGLKDAADIQGVLGKDETQARVVALRDTFRTNLYRSLDLAMKVRGIEYIPGCVELGDFDATSTTIALTPCNELHNLPKPQVYNTFDRYYEFFRNRRDDKIEWENYTPYENRLIGSFIMLDQPDRAHELIDYFIDDQRPAGWNHWAEVVWKDPRTAKYIGDMPHTWVGSDFINAFRSMFVYENEYDSTLVIGAALYQDWIDAPDGISIESLPTYYGELSYSVKKSGSEYRIEITGDLELPANGIRIRNFNQSAMPRKVQVNGKRIQDFTHKSIPVRSVPATIRVSY